MSSTGHCNRCGARTDGEAFELTLFRLRPVTLAGGIVEDGEHVPLCYSCQLSLLEFLRLSHEEIRKYFPGHR